MSQFKHKQFYAIQASDRRLPCWSRNIEAFHSLFPQFPSQSHLRQQGPPQLPKEAFLTKISPTPHSIQFRISIYAEFGPISTLLIQQGRATTPFQRAGLIPQFSKWPNPTSSTLQVEHSQRQLVRTRKLGSPLVQRPDSGMVKNNKRIFHNFAKLSVLLDLTHRRYFPSAWLQTWHGIIRSLLAPMGLLTQIDAPTRNEPLACMCLNDGIINLGPKWRRHQP